VQVTCAACACNDDDRGRSRRPGANDRDGRTCRVLSDRTIERSGSAVCGLHRARGDEEYVFLGYASKPSSTAFR
jgi:hypothetical protein